MKKILLLIFYFVLPLALFAQDEDYSILMPDTVFAQKFVKTTVINFDSLQVIFLDTFHHPDCFLVRTNSKYKSTLSIAVMKKKSWELYEIPIEDLGYYQVDRINFDGKGNNELLIKTSSSGLLSHRGANIWDASKEFYIIDLDKFVLFGPFQNYISHYAFASPYNDSPPDFENTDDSDLTDQNISDDVDDSDQYWHNLDEHCTNYAVQFIPGEIVFTESGDCNDFDEKIKVEIPMPKTIKYTLRKNYLLKVK